MDKSMVIGCSFIIITQQAFGESDAKIETLEIRN
jgi:hypothetical protein